MESESRISDLARLLPARRRVTALLILHAISWRINCYEVGRKIRRFPKTDVKYV